MTDENELRWRLFQDHMTHARHHETLRATTTTVLLAVAAGVLGLLGAARAWPLRFEDLPLTLFLVLLGIFGAFFNAKYRERFVFHMNRARQYRDALDRDLPNAGIKSAQPVADAKTKSEYPWLYPSRLYIFWVGLQLMVALLGLVLTSSVFWPQPPASPSAPAKAQRTSKPSH